MVDALIDRHPALRGQLLTDDGELNRFVNVYVNGQDVRYLAGLDTPVAAGRRGPPAARHGGRLTAVSAPALRALGPADPDERGHEHRHVRGDAARRTSTTTRSCPATAAGSPTSSTRSATRRWSRSRG